MKTRSKEEPYRIDKGSLQTIDSIKCKKLIHGIGFPVGGTRPPESERYPPLLQMISLLNPPWVSEHLSFNRAEGSMGEFKTGFMLPPRQTRDGVLAAIESVLSMRKEISLPLAVETGVNYLKPRSDELSDGKFVTSVAESADCGILLDLHNLWTNEINGRQTISDFLKEISLERVWEVHMAGGLEYEGYWVDAHSGKIQKELMEVAQKVVPRLPNLKALIFEIFPSFVLKLGIDVVREQLEELQKIWNLRAPEYACQCVNIIPRGGASNSKVIQDNTNILFSPREWEDVLGSLVVGQNITGNLADELSADPGIQIIRGLLETFRSSMIVSTLRMTSRLLMLSIGKPQFQNLLRQYWKEHTPNLFAYDEAIGFSRYISTEVINVRYLGEVLRYELAILETLIDETARLVRFDHDPVVILRSLAEARMPQNPKEGNFEVEITPEDISSDKEGTGMSSQDYLSALAHLQH
jgi:uncharacterized protein (UPF0276 family)